MNQRIDRIVDAASQGLSEAERKSMYQALTLISENLEQMRSAEQGGNHSI